MPQLTGGILPVRLPDAAQGPAPADRRTAAGYRVARPAEWLPAGAALSRNGAALAAACLAGPGWVTMTTG